MTNSRRSPARCLVVWASPCLACSPSTRSALPISSWNLWLLRHSGVGLYEEVSARRTGRSRRVRSCSTEAGLLVPAGARVRRGRGAACAVPRCGGDAGVRVEPALPDVSKKPNDDYIGRFMVESVCDMGTRAVGPQVKVDCFDPLILARVPASFGWSHRRGRLLRAAVVVRQLPRHRFRIRGTLA